MRLYSATTTSTRQIRYESENHQSFNAVSIEAFQLTVSSFARRTRNAVVNRHRGPKVGHGIVGIGNQCRRGAADFEFWGRFKCIFPNKSRCIKSVILGE